LHFAAEALSRGKLNELNQRPIGTFRPSPSLIVTALFR
jgi:hypothetical protein